MFDGLLQAIGLLVLFMAGAGFWVFLYCKRRLERWRYYGVAASINRFPGRVFLRRLEEFRWLKGERAGQRVKTFQQAGFEDLGGFAVHELPGARLFALRQASSGMIAVVHEQDELGTWSDVMLFKPSEPQPIVASSLLKRAHFHLLPGDPKLFEPGGTVEQLCEAVGKAAGRGIVGELLTAEGFQSRFEQAFALAVDARLLQPLEDYELRRLVRERGECGEGMEESEFDSIKRALPVAINNELRLVCVAQFLRETTLAAVDWQRARDRIAVIHDRTPLHELAGRMIYGVFWTKRVRQRLRRFGRHRGAPRQLFAELNGTLPPWDRYKKIGEVSRPIPADIYRAPLESEST